MAKWLWLSAIIIVGDQITKWLADTQLGLYKPKTITPFFDITLMYNEGAAFSFLYDAGGWQRWLFISLAAIIALVVIFILIKGAITRFTALALSILLGGTIGNLIDRIAHGHVIDFIHLHYSQYYWPAFNIADIAISVAAGLLIWDIFKSPH